MSKVQVDTIDTRSGTSTMQIGSTNTSTINIGVSGDTVNIPSGVTIANAGTATGFGEDNTPAFRAKTNATLTFSSGYVKIAFNTEEWDTDGAYDHSTNYRFTVPSGKAGKYHFTIGIEQSGTSAQGLNYPLVIYKNGSQLRFVNTNPSYGGNVERFRAVWSETLDLAVSDYIEVYCNGSGFQSQDAFFSGFKLAGV